MFKNAQSPVTSLRFAAGAAGVILVFGRALRMLVVEHARAQRATILAELPQRRQAELRALYAADDATGKLAPPRRSPAEITLRSPVAVGRSTSGTVVAALVLVAGLIALVMA